MPFVLDGEDLLNSSASEGGLNEAGYMTKDIEDGLAGTESRLMCKSVTGGNRTMGTGLQGYAPPPYESA